MPLPSASTRPATVRAARSVWTPGSWPEKPSLSRTASLIVSAQMLEQGPEVVGIDRRAVVLLVWQGEGHEVWVVQHGGQVLRLDANAVVNGLVDGLVGDQQRDSRHRLRVETKPVDAVLALQVLASVE